MFYSNDKKKGNWFAFLGRPVIKINIDPVLGTDNPFAVKSFPRLREFIEELIAKDFDDLCLPNTKPMNIPATTVDNVKWPRKSRDQFV